MEPHQIELPKHLVLDWIGDQLNQFKPRIFEPIYTNS